MTTTPGEPISDGDAPTGDPDLAPHEQPDRATKSQPSSGEADDQETESPLDADEGDPDLHAHHG